MERRKAPRRSLAVDVTVIHDDGAARCAAGDISTGGLHLAVGEVRCVPQAGPVLMYFELPGDPRPHFALGQTRRIDDDAEGAGVRFTFIPEATREGVSAYLAG